MSKSNKKSKKNQTAKKTSKPGWFNAKRVFIFSSLFLIFFTIFIFLSSDTDIKYKAFKPISNGRVELIVPEEFNETLNSQDIVDYEHKNHSSAKALSHLRVESQYIGVKDLEATKSVITDQLKAGEGDFYNVFKKKTASGPIAKELSFGKFRDFKGGKVNDAITADFSYSSEGQIVLGKLLIAFSQDSMFFAAVESTDEIWQNNQKIWDNILASFKLT